MRAKTRERLLRLYTILLNETDDEHELSLKDFEEKLKLEFGVDFTVKRNVLREDLIALETMLPMSINQNKGPHGKNLYSYQERRFELYELRMLMDAVLSARFMSYKEAKKLIEKLKELTSQYQAKKLHHDYYIDDTIRNESAYFKYGVDQLHRAISETRCITFQYGKFDGELHFSLRRDGQFYPVKPYALTWNDGFYYLIGEYEPEKQIRHYRVDRMRAVQIQDETFERPAFNLPEYINRSFNMFAGTDDYIEIQFHEDILNAMIDRFGIDADIRKVHDDTFVIKTKASISHGLVHWLLGWGSNAKVLSPQYLVEQIRDETKKMMEVYHQ